MSDLMVLLPDQRAELDPTVSIYALIDPRDQSIRYIGKANDPAKRLASHLKDSLHRDTPVYRWIRKLASAGMAPEMEVIVVCKLDDWQTAERLAIEEARNAGIRLLNVTAGGNEPYCSVTTRADNGRKVAASRDKRKWRLLRDLGSALKAGYVSETTKAKMRARPDVFGQFATHL